MWQSIVDGLKAFADWFLGLFTALAESLWSAVLALIPDDLEPTVTSILPYLRFANEWIPLDFAGVLFSAWLTLAFFMASMRFVKQFIPTVSG